MKVLCLKRKKKWKAIGCVLLCSFFLLSGCRTEKPNETKKAETEQRKEEQEEALIQEKREQEEKEQAAKEAAEKECAEAITLVIDPGHSGVVEERQEPVGPGAQEYKAGDTYGTSGISTGIPEYELTLDLALQLKTELETRGYKIVMTRDTNEVPRSCLERADIMNQAGAAACLRIHANGSEDSSVQGAMTICTTPQNPYVPQMYASSRMLSDCVLDSLVEATGCVSQGVWETDTMSGNNWSQIPVTIVEVGYMTNPEEDVLLSQEDYRKKIVFGLADGLEEFIKKSQNEN